MSSSLKFTIKEVEDEEKLGGLFKTFAIALSMISFIYLIINNK
jgi:hypothetical protein